MSETKEKTFPFQVGSLARSLIEAVIVVIVGYMAGQVSAIHATLLELSEKQIEMKVYLDQLLDDRKKVDEMYNEWKLMKDRVDKLEGHGR